MRSHFICTLTAFSLFSGMLIADDNEPVRSVSISETIPEKKSHHQEIASAAPVRKKTKAHFVGSKRPQQNSSAPPAATEEGRRSSRVNNAWVKSKTYPKQDRKIAQGQERASPIYKTSAAASSVPNIYANQERFESDQSERMGDLERKLGALQAQVDDIQHPEDSSYPRTGVYAPRGGVYFTGEWLFWQTREGGLEFAVERSSATPGDFTDAVPKKLHFDWQSGFRVGFGVHLPHDGWDIFINYTNFQPDASAHAHGSVFPLLAYQRQFPISNVTHAHAHWGIKFQSADVEIGRAYYLAKSLALRPFVGCKGAWIDQHAHVTYTGGDIPADETFKIRTHNDYKGAGLRFGLGSNWEWCAGWSFVSNLSGSLLIGHFDLSQDQTLPTDVKTIDLDTNLNLVTPAAQLSLGIAWDKNFCRDRCHIGVSASFESQYFWRQNQIERFTDTSAPTYVRPSDDLAFYGLSLMVRLDF